MKGLKTREAHFNTRFFKVRRSKTKIWDAGLKFLWTELDDYKKEKALCT